MRAPFDPAFSPLRNDERLLSYSQARALGISERQYKKARGSTVLSSVRIFRKDLHDAAPSAPLDGTDPNAESPTAASTQTSEIRASEIRAGRFEPPRRRREHPASGRFPDVAPGADPEATPDVGTWDVARTLAATDPHLIINGVTAAQRLDLRLPWRLSTDRAICVNRPKSAGPLCRAGIDCTRYAYAPRMWSTTTASDAPRCPGPCSSCSLC